MNNKILRTGSKNGICFIWEYSGAYNHEDRNLEIYFYKGGNGIAGLANEYTKCFWHLFRKDIVELNSKLHARGLSFKKYDHFGENARKLIMVLK